MIQFRWKKLDEHHPAESELSIVTVDGQPCILEYKQHFVPTSTYVPAHGKDLIVLKPARDCDAEWQPVTGDLL